MRCPILCQLQGLPKFSWPCFGMPKDAVSWLPRLSRPVSGGGGGLGNLTRLNCRLLKLFVTDLPRLLFTTLLRKRKAHIVAVIESEDDEKLALRLNNPHTGSVDECWQPHPEWWPMALIPDLALQCKDTTIWQRQRKLELVRVPSDGQASFDSQAGLDTFNNLVASRRNKRHAINRPELFCLHRRKATGDFGAACLIADLEGV